MNIGVRSHHAQHHAQHLGDLLSEQQRRQQRLQGGVHKGTVKAEPLTLINGKEKLTLRFDCKPCEMHVVGRIRKSILRANPVGESGAPLRFYRTRPAVA